MVDTPENSEDGDQIGNRHSPDNDGEIDREQTTVLSMSEEITIAWGSVVLVLVVVLLLAMGVVFIQDGRARHLEL